MDTLIYGSPGGASYHVWLIDRAGVNIKLDRLKQALKDCNEVIACAEKGDNRMLAQALFARGVARALLGESLAATEDYEKALQLQPDLPRALEHSDDQIKLKSQLDMALSRFVENAVFGSTPADLRTIERREKEFQPRAQAINTKSAGLRAFIFGPLFFMHHKCWGDAIKLLFIDLAVVNYVKESGGNPILAVALVHFVYAVSASGIIKRAYEQRG